MIGTTLAILDSFIVNVAAPSIHTDLNTTFAQLELIIGAYVLVYGLFLVTGGRFGDIFGYRRIFVAGVLLFVAASLACSLATTAEALIVFRVVQALGAAMLYPQVLSGLQTMFKGREQAIAFGVFGATIGLASICAQLVGGMLVSLDLFDLGWRTIFLINIPLGLLAVAGAMLTLPGGRNAHRPSLDPIGGVILTLALVLLLLPLVLGREMDWPVWMIAMLVLSVPAFFAFLGWERAVGRRGGDPLVSMDLFRNGPFSVGTGIAMAFFACNSGLFLILTLALQLGLDFSAAESGLAFTPLAVAFMAASLLASRITARLGPRGVLVLGYMANAVGVLALILTTAAVGTDLSIAALAPSLIVIGFGQGLGVSPLMALVLQGVPARDSGAAGGVLETVIQVAWALGIALLGLIYFTLVGGHDDAMDPETATTAFNVSLFCNLGLALIAATLVFRLPKSVQTPA
ncbi:MFS transporter [Streptomyces sp. DSM 44917]|uniref:MFS transporter n=2 Tax=Streptomyces boetiae TaxID=3075541 RepID=A0ABU2LCU4_9ACTN|nr:MFS transporter [Streptomyces sp. DSM 44917]